MRATGMMMAGTVASNLGGSGAARVADNWGSNCSIDWSIDWSINWSNNWSNN